MKYRLSRIIPLLAVLVVGTGLLFALADRTLQGDPWDWLQTAQKLVRTGDTGPQHRNILYSYLLAIPLLFGWDAITFGLVLSGLSLLLSAALLYHLNLRYTSPAVAGFVSLFFVLSYPFLRYATQVFSDLPTVFFIVAMVYCHLRYLEEERPAYLVLGYLMAGAAVSLRYAAGFFILAYLYFMWVTRRAYRWHALGVALAVLPYIPQLLYNVRYLGSVLAVSYTSVHPIFGWQFFFTDLGSGHNWQLLDYLRYMFLDFRGLFVPLTPLAAWGMLRAFRELRRPQAIYLVLFVVSFILLLPFYAFFSNRYAIPAIIPCFVWLALGISALLRWAAGRPHWQRQATLVALALLAYGMFEINFQVIGSSRSLHELRERVFARLHGYVREGDVVFTIDSVRPFATRDAPVKIKAPRTETVTPELLRQYGGQNIYVVWTPDLITSEGGSWSLDIKPIRDRLEPLATVESAPVTELLLYRALRWLGRSDSIPHERWFIYRVITP